MANKVTGAKSVLTLLTLASIAAITFAFFYRRISGVILYDYNFETFQHTLTADQKRGIIQSLDSITAGYTLLLVITNVLWMVGAWYLLVRTRETKRES